MNTEPEYKIVYGSMDDCQKRLNQWRHEFNLNVMAMCKEHGMLTILLTKERKADGGE